MQNNKKKPLHKILIMKVRTKNEISIDNNGISQNEIGHKSDTNVYKLL